MKVWTFCAHGFATSEVAFLLCVLNASNGWRAYNVAFQLAPHGTTPDFDMYLTRGADMVRMFPHGLRGMSVTDRRGKRPVVHFNADNWRTPPPQSGYKDVDRYRTYVVNHEVGHVLGLGHAQCPANGDAAPVMMQQTRGCGECRPDPWVVKS